MKVERVRNYSYAPHLGKEGQFICPMPKPPEVGENQVWHANLKPYERLFYHQTLCSARSSKRFLQTTLIPKDSLDLQLQSCYVHSKESFPTKVDVVLQVETCSKFPDTFRVLRNTEDIAIKELEVIGHPLKIGITMNVIYRVFDFFYLHFLF